MVNWSLVEILGFSVPIIFVGIHCFYGEADEITRKWESGGFLRNAPNDISGQ